MADAVATVEAKRKNLTFPPRCNKPNDTVAVSNRRVRLCLPEMPDSEYRVLFAFSANGRPYLRQLETKSGIWFL
ncbi:MAG: hypothetical protein U0X75_12975 [Acidobacteriota bacterium]